MRLDYSESRVNLADSQYKELKHKADLSQSLADALEVVASWNIPDDPMFKSETAQKIYIGHVARAALANYRKGAE